MIIRNTYDKNKLSKYLLQTNLKFVYFIYG